MFLYFIVGRICKKKVYYCSVSSLRWLRLLKHLIENTNIYPPTCKKLYRFEQTNLICIAEHFHGSFLILRPNILNNLLRKYVKGFKKKFQLLTYMAPTGEHLVQLFNPVILNGIINCMRYVLNHPEIVCSHSWYLMLKSIFFYFRTNHLWLG